MMNHGTVSSLAAPSVPGSASERSFARSDKAIKNGRRHERRDHRHDDKGGEKAFGNDPTLQADVAGKR
jgi:hypothetical protein